MSAASRWPGSRPWRILCCASGATPRARSARGLRPLVVSPGISIQTRTTAGLRYWRTSTGRSQRLRRACLPCSTVCRALGSRCAGCRRPSNWARRVAMPRVPRWMDRDPAPTTSTWSTRRSGRAGPCRRSPIMRVCPAIISRAHWRWKRPVRRCCSSRWASTLWRGLGPVCRATGGRTGHV